EFACLINAVTLTVQLTSSFLEPTLVDSKAGEVVGNIVSDWTQDLGLMLLTKYTESRARRRPADEKTTEAALVQTPVCASGPRRIRRVLRVAGKSRVRFGIHRQE